MLARQTFILLRTVKLSRKIKRGYKCLRFHGVYFLNMTTNHNRRYLHPNMTQPSRHSTIYCYHTEVDESKYNPLSYYFAETAGEDNNKN